MSNSRSSYSAVKIKIVVHLSTNSILLLNDSISTRKVKAKLTVFKYLTTTY